MAGSNHLLTELHQQLARLDDEGLAALASAGLLRRARKDLESQQPKLQESVDAVTVKLATHTVTMDAKGAAHARCTCPAKTVCQHVLAAFLYLKSLPESGPSAEGVAGIPEQSALESALLAIELSELIRYAGKSAVREALRNVAAQEPVHIAFDKAIIIRLERQGIEFRYVGGGPESLISDFRGRTANKLAAQAILSFHRTHGVQHALPGETPKESEHAAEVQELRATVLRKVERLLRECIDVGLTHISDTLIERFSSLASVAEGAKLHRLSLALSRLSDHVDLILERHARADAAGFLAELANTYALTEALQGPDAWRRVELVGESRSSYDEIETLHLYSTGAYPWQTSSGYWGLTLLFWSILDARWLTYTDSRPVGTPGFSPTESYKLNGPWRGCKSPAAMMGHGLILRKASANRAGRLSGGSSINAEVSPAPVPPPDFAGRAFRNWKGLRAFAHGNLEGIGLSERSSVADYVVLYPQRFLARTFEGPTQTLSWEIEDDEGETLLLRLEYSDVSAAAVERLDTLQPESGIGIVAQLNSSARILSARPLSLLRRTKHVVDNLFLDEPPPVGRGQALLGKLRAALATPPSGRSVEPEVQPMDATYRMLGDLNGLLLSIAERGSIAHAGYADALTSVLRKLQDGGLALLDPESTIDSAVVLRARYLSHLAHACLTRGV
jgi:hypothetical protein